VAAFNDLGEGTSFGSRTFNFSDSNTLTSYVLNQNFINSFNSSLPGNFVIGARNGNEGISSNYVYGFSGGGAPATLDLQFGPDIPAVPGPLPILGVAAAFGYSRKLRKRIKSSRPEVISTTAV
jgi:hypothetical protein